MSGSDEKVPEPPVRRGLRLGGPRWLRILLLVGLAVLLWAAFRSHQLVGLVLLAAVVGLWIRAPDPERAERQRSAARREAARRARRIARTTSPLTPRGSVQEGDRSATARSLDGHLPADVDVEVVNEVDGELMVRRIARSTAD